MRASGRRSRARLLITGLAVVASGLAVSACDEVPSNLQTKIIAASKAERGEVAVEEV